MKPIRESHWLFGFSDAVSRVIVNAGRYNKISVEVYFENVVTSPIKLWSRSYSRNKKKKKKKKWFIPAEVFQVEKTFRYNVEADGT